MKDRVEKVLDRIRPLLQAEGGDIELVDVDEEGNVKVKLKGTCGVCPMSQITLAWSVEREIKKEIPEVKRVISV